MCERNRGDGIVVAQAEFAMRGCGWQGGSAGACRQLAAANRWMEGDSALRSAVVNAERALMAASSWEGNLV